jgi:hypothetical protein
MLVRLQRDVPGSTSWFAPALPVGAAFTVTYRDRLRPAAGESCP